MQSDYSKNPFIIVIYILIYSICDILYCFYLSKTTIKLENNQNVIPLFIFGFSLKCFYYFCLYENVSTKYVLDV